MDQNVIVSFEDFAFDNSKANLSGSAFDAVDDSPFAVFRHGRSLGSFFALTHRA